MRSRLANAGSIPVPKQSVQTCNRCGAKMTHLGTLPPSRGKPAVANSHSTARSLNARLGVFEKAYSRGTCGGATS